MTFQGRLVKDITSLKNTLADLRYTSSLIDNTLIIKLSKNSRSSSSSRLLRDSTHNAHLTVLYQLTQDLVGCVFGDKGYLLNNQKKDFL